MQSGIEHPDLAVYRLVKSGDTGLNLSLTDLFGRTLELPNLRQILRSIFTREPILVRVKGFPSDLIKRLELIQRKVDEQVQRTIEEAKRKTR